MTFALIGYGTAFNRDPGSPRAHGLIQIFDGGLIDMVPDGEMQHVTALVQPASAIAWDDGYPLQSGLPWVICTMNEDVPETDLAGQEFYDAASMRRRLNMLLEGQECPLIRVFYGLAGHQILVETYRVPPKSEKVVTGSAGRADV